MRGERSGLQRIALIAVLLVAAFVVVLQARSAGVELPGSSSSPSASPSATSSPSSRPGSGAVRVAELPPQARDTIERIQRGGPFSSTREGGVFENREGLLPAQPDGYYHEYTVPTPGEDDRGARRIVAGSDGTLYWTPDHYRTFRRIADATGSAP